MADYDSDYIENPVNPLLPSSSGVDDILALYSPSELENYKVRGMLDSRGVPTIPSGGKFNSRGEPISNDLFTMTPEEKNRVTETEKKIKEMTFGGNSSISSPLNLVSPPAQSYNNRKLSLSEMTNFAQQAGFDSKTAPIIAAIAMGESYGWTNAYNGVGKDDSYGITQINAKAHGSVAKEAYNNPLRAMQLAYQVSNGGTDFSPWSVYKSGDYKKYLDEDSGVSAGLEISSDLKNANLSGRLSDSALAMPDSDSKVEKAKLADSLAGPLPDSTGSSAISPLSLLSLLGQYKLRPINYDPWKYLPKASETKMSATKGPATGDG